MGGSLMGQLGYCANPVRLIDGVVMKCPVALYDQAGKTWRCNTTLNKGCRAYRKHPGRAFE